MSGSSLRKLFIVVGLTGLALLAFVVFSLWRLGLLAIVFKQNPGRFDRPRFEAIIAEVRQADLKPETEQQFFLDDLLDPKSLRRVSYEEISKITSGRVAGRVWAQVSPEGALQVVIETRDNGHAGQWGFAYSDRSPKVTPRGEDDRWFYLAVPSHLNEVRTSWQIDNHWWKVFASD